ncbi:primosomal protein DnaI [Lacticaseibacillus hulanensis]|uniref:primosomal protein DnaI n=1 Tax=Lacticaseibacillus hulanensis TaxID=2493111 RepID=UPI000FD8B869|nr:primosomal protein DnaI [Lacticaseibacillus hulanensis]
MDNLSEHLQDMMRGRGVTRKFNEMKQTVMADQGVQEFLQAHKDELAPDAADRGVAKLYEYIRQRAKSGGADSIAPGYVPFLVVAGHLIDIEYRPSKAKIIADAQSERVHLVRMVNVPKDVRAARLAKYDVVRGREEAIQAAFDFVLGLTDEGKTFVTGLYLDGRFGVGKTYLLGAIANELAERGVAATLMHLPTFAVEMKDSIKDGGVLARIDAVKKVPVLMLDDIGAESFSPWFRDEVLGVILQYRMQEQLPTCFSSNKTKAQLADFLAGKERGDEETVKAARIMERINYLATEIKIEGPNRRNPREDVAAPEQQ